MATQNKGNTRKSGANARRKPSKIIRQKSRLAKIIKVREHALKDMEPGPAFTKKRNKLWRDKARLERLNSLNTRTSSSLVGTVRKGIGRR